MQKKLIFLAQRFKLDRYRFLVEAGKLFLWSLYYFKSKRKANTIF